MSSVSLSSIRRIWNGFGGVARSLFTACDCHSISTPRFGVHNLTLLGTRHSQSTTGLWIGSWHQFVPSTSFHSGRDGGDGGGRNDNKNNNNKVPKSNFARDVLKPASEGILQGKHHQSGIPNLASRKPHATLTSQRGRAGQKQANIDENEIPVSGAIPLSPFGDDFASTTTKSSSSSSSSSDSENMFQSHSFGKMGLGDNGGNGNGSYNNNNWNHNNDDSGDEEMSDEEEIAFYAQILNEDKDFYWNEHKYEMNEKIEAEMGMQDSRIEAYAIALEEEERRKRMGANYVPLIPATAATDENNTVDHDDEADTKLEHKLEEEGTSQPHIDGVPDVNTKVQDLALEDDYDRWFEKNFDLLNIAETDRVGFHEDVARFPSQEAHAEYMKNYNQVSDALWMNGKAIGMGHDLTTGHPTRYSMIKYEKPHPDSAKEPRPYIPSNRLQPDAEFFDKHTRFLYMTGLPVFEIDGATADLTNPVHFNLFRTELSRFAGVDSTEHVYPATPDAGYIGFTDSKELAKAILEGPAVQQVTSPPYFRPFLGIEFTNHQERIQDFVQDPAATVVLYRIPGKHSPASLIRDLFPPDTAIGEAYGDRTADDVLFVHNSQALLRFASPDQAASVLESDFVTQQLQKQFGTYHVQYLRARRNMVHRGFRGPVKDQQVRVPGRKLVVDGDMPTANFFRSHAECLRLVNLDPSVTKYQLSQLVQPYCAMRRDVEGSIEIVACEDFRPTGQVYIGFDIVGEAKAVLEGLGDRLVLNDRKVKLYLVHNYQIPGRLYKGPEKRPDRPLNELLEDLNGWERYVNPADIQLLEDHGIQKWVIDDALRLIRFKNETFGPLDHAQRNEALEGNSQPGQQYRELVEEYITILKENLATRENPGSLLEHEAFPGEEIDLSIFDKEEHRQRVLLAHRKAHGGEERIAQLMQKSIK